MNGGYLIVSKADTNLYEKLNKALTLGKPVLWYEDEDTCYYIDTITKSGTDIILTKGGKTITIESDGDITESGDVENPTLETIKDKNGNLRFIEGNVAIPTISGLTFTYNKWSISGTHLMIVLAGEIEDATTISADELLNIDLPQWIKDKIFTTSGIIVYSQSATLMAMDLSTTQWLLYLQKPNDNTINIYNTEITTTKKYYFRTQFDLLIDAE